MPRIEVVSHPLCPHLQRLVLVALAGGWQREKEFNVIYLPYPTFLEQIRRYSPDGQGPVLQIDGVTKSIRTEDIAEFLDLSTGHKLLPKDPDTLLRVRGREHAVRVALDALRSVFTAKTAEDLSSALDGLFVHLIGIDKDLRTDGTDQNTIRMDVASLAPMFSLLVAYDGLIKNKRWSAAPRLQAIAKAESAQPLVQASRCPNYMAEFDAFFAFSNSPFPALMSSDLRSRTVLMKGSEGGVK